MNIWCMLNWILSQNCRNILPFHRVDQLTSSAKTLGAVVPDKLLAANADTVAYQMEEYKNSDLVVIFYYLNSFHSNSYVAFSLLYVMLRENHKINAVCFPSIHNGCNPSYKVWRWLRTGEYCTDSSFGRNNLLHACS